MMKWQKLLRMWCACMVLLALGSCVPDIEDLQENNGINSTPGNRSYVDLGLSVKWANCNIGADCPWEYGAYYAWGEIEEKKDIYLDNYTWYCENADGTYFFEPIDYDISGSYRYDAAYRRWGSDWRIPTLEEIKELMYECAWSWTRVQGVYGYRVTGPSGNSIFLPAAGDRNGDEYEERGVSGYYWCGTSAYDAEEEPYGLWAHIIFFSDGEAGDLYYAERSWGFSIRPVYVY